MESTYFEGGLNGYRELVAKGLTPTARDADPEVKRWFAAILARYRRGKLKPEELQAIESIPGHVWERSEAVATRASTATSEQIKQVASFAKAIGTADFDKNRVTSDDYPVGLALQRLRQKHRAGKLSRAEVEELNKLPNWQWAKAVPRMTSRASFEDRLSQAIRVANGKSLRAIPVKFRDKDGFRAGRWVSEQIVQYNRKTLRKERARQLEQTFGWYWGDKVEEDRSK
jgi:hypothetical protein